MSILTGILLILAVAAAIALPLARRPTSDIVTAVRRSEKTEVLVHEKDIALLAIKEAEFDHAMGKLSEDDYAILRGEYEQRALAALSALDRLPKDRSDQSRPDDLTPGDRPAPFCASCGHAFRSDDRFCASCGSSRRSLDA